MISIVIPTYNEKENIKLLIDRVEKAMNKHSKDFEIVVVDDNSPDGTWKIVKGIGNKKRFVKLVKRSGKLGLTSAVLDGVKKASGNKIIVMDADLSHPPEKLPEIAKELEKFDLVIGSRNMVGGGVNNWPIHRKGISKGATLLAKLILNTGCSDPMSGFFGVKKNIIKKTKFKTKGYKILLNILAYNKGLKIKEIPYLFSDRHAGKTKLGNSEILRYLEDLIALRT